MGYTPTYQNVIGFFANGILREARLVRGFEFLFAKLKDFVTNHLFDHVVNLDDLNTLRNLSELDATRTIHESFRKAINDLTVVDRGTSRIQNRIKLSTHRPDVVDRKAELRPRKSIFNRIIGDSGLELDCAPIWTNAPILCPAPRILSTSASESSAGKLMVQSAIISPISW